MAYRFNGSSDYLYRTDICGITGYPLTMACMFKADTHKNQNPFCFSKSGSTATYNLLYMRDPADDDVIAWSREEATSDYIDTTTSYTTGTWQHACGVFTNATSRTVYLDGGGAQTGTGSVTWPAAMDRTSIGSRILGSVANYWDGDIAEVALWDVALTASEVALLAAGASPLLVRPSNLVAYWPLHTNANDIVGGYNMSTSGSPTVSDHPRIIVPSSAMVAVAPYAAPPVTDFWRKIVTEYTSPRFVTIELGDDSDTTLSRASAGDVNIKGNIIYRAGGTDVPVADGGTGASSLTDHGILLGSGTDPVTPLGVATNGQLPIGSTGADPVLSALTQGQGIAITNGAGSIGVACDVELHEVTQTHKHATVLTVTTGTLDAGTYTDTQVWADGNYVSVSEAASTPGFDVSLKFESVTTFTRLGVAWYYTGLTTGHYCQVQIYDDTNTTWRTLFTDSGSQGFNYRYTDIPTDTIANYINGSGEVLVRFYHPGAGNASHDLYIDYVALIS